MARNNASNYEKDFSSLFPVSPKQGIGKRLCSRYSIRSVIEYLPEMPVLKSGDGCEGTGLLNRDRSEPEEKRIAFKEL
jgi:hypothetical protein